MRNTSTTLFYIFKLTYIVLILSIVSIIVGCSIPREEQAQITFNDAIDAYMNRHYNTAKLLLDSVIFTYPDLKNIVRESKDMLEIIYKTEQERNLLFLDSLLTSREKEIEPLLKQFEPEDEQAEMPVLIHKKQNVQHAWERSYIRAHTDKNGTFYISSHYIGSAAIHHYAIRVAIDNSYQQTDSITDDAYAHSFRDGENVWEIIKFKKGSDNGVGSFIASNFDKNIVVTFVGEKSNYKIQLTETDKQAFRETYQLAILLREIVQIRSQIRNVKIAMKKKKNGK